MMISYKCGNIRSMEGNSYNIITNLKQIIINFLYRIKSKKFK